MNNQPPKPQEFDPVLEEQKAEHQRQVEEAEKAQAEGDANEAKGLNRDGSPKEPKVEEPAPAVEPAPAKDIATLKIKGVTDAPQGGAGLTEDQLKVKEKLAKEEKYAFYIPLDPGESRGAVRPVSINTYRCEVPKGVQVMLPKSIYKLLMECYNVEAEALDLNENNLGTADARKRDALNLN